MGDGMRLVSVVVPMGILMPHVAVEMRSEDPKGQNEVLLLCLPDKVIDLAAH